MEGSGSGQYYLILVRHTGHTYTHTQTHTHTHTYINIAHLQQQCHNSKFVTFQERLFKGFEVLQFSMSATTTQLLSSGEFCKLRYDTIPVKS